MSSPESRAFIESMVHVISDLNAQGVEDTIVVGFDIYLENVKRLKNSDLLVAITSAEEADAKFAKVNKVQITDHLMRRRYPYLMRSLSNDTHFSIEIYASSVKKRYRDLSKTGNSTA